MSLIYHYEVLQDIQQFAVNILWTNLFLAKTIYTPGNMTLSHGIRQVNPVRTVDNKCQLNIFYTDLYIHTQFVIVNNLSVTSQMLWDLVKTSWVTLVAMATFLKANNKKQYIYQYDKQGAPPAAAGNSPGSPLTSVAKYMRSSLQESCKRHGTQLRDCFKYSIP